MIDLMQNVLLIFIEVMCCIRVFLRLLVQYDIKDGLISYRFCCYLVVCVFIHMASLNILY